MVTSSLKVYGKVSVGPWGELDGAQLGGEAKR